MRGVEQELSIIPHNLRSQIKAPDTISEDPHVAEPKRVCVKSGEHQYIQRIATHTRLSLQKYVSYLGGR